MNHRRPCNHVAPDLRDWEPLDARRQRVRLDPAHASTCGASPAAAAATTSRTSASSCGGSTRYRHTRSSRGARRRPALASSPLGHDAAAVHAARRPRTRSPTSPSRSTCRGRSARRSLHARKALYYGRGRRRRRAVDNVDPSLGSTSTAPRSRATTVGVCDLSDDGAAGRTCRRPAGSPSTRCSAHRAAAGPRRPASVRVDLPLRLRRRPRRRRVRARALVRRSRHRVAARAGRPRRRSRPRSTRSAATAWSRSPTAAATRRRCRVDVRRRHVDHARRRAVRPTLVLAAALDSPAARTARSRSTACWSRRPLRVPAGRQRARAPAPRALHPGARARARRPTAPRRPASRASWSTRRRRGRVDRAILGALRIAAGPSVASRGLASSTRPTPTRGLRRARRRRRRAARWPRGLHGDRPHPRAVDRWSRTSCCLALAAPRPAVGRASPSGRGLRALQLRAARLARAAALPLPAGERRCRVERRPRFTSLRYGARRTASSAHDARTRSGAAPTTRRDGRLPLALRAATRDQPAHAAATSTCGSAWRPGSSMRPDATRVGDVP